MRTVDRVGIAVTRVGAAAKTGVTHGKRGLVIANERSIAYGCAQAFYRKDAELAITYCERKGRAVSCPLAELPSSRTMTPCAFASRDRRV
jgi:enoyl-[acyl-carrier-protein] reductase (NADH)